MKRRERPVTPTPQHRVANRVRIGLLVSIGTLGVVLSAPAIAALGSRNGMDDDIRQGVLVALLELSVIAGTLTYFSPSRPTYERVLGFGFVAGAMGVTTYAGVAAYGYLGFIAPVAYLVATHLTAAPRTQAQGRADDLSATTNAAPGPLGGQGALETPVWPAPAGGSSVDVGHAPFATHGRDADVDTPAPPAPLSADGAGSNASTVAERLAALRAQHGRQSKHRERAALGVGWGPYNEADTQLNGHHPEASTT